MDSGAGMYERAHKPATACRSISPVKPGNARIDLSSDANTTSLPIQP
jgi:hypothetical protein